MTSSLGTLIKERRQGRAWSQQALADKMEVSRVAIGQWEKGETMPALERLLKLCDLLEINFEEVVSTKDRALARDHRLTADANPSSVGTPNTIPVFLTVYASDEADYLKGSTVISTVRRPPGLADVSGDGAVYAVYLPSSALSPRFKEGEMIFLNKNRPPSPGDMVSVELPNPAEPEKDRWILRRLLERKQGKIILEKINSGEKETLQNQEFLSVHRIADWPELLG
ncbi:helix-turn-helix domain-containing protein [Rhizobium sp. SG741]|uniref:helix-turn-helix domain-containing protein n=1 Tax=Rhizobium sp. SG741 TaxID=2587114 RepID=UPI001447C803|nr:helix-turn-helix domain-containing protein [Rhizobium sp. SG741]NKJ03453.1 transcriptional regulator with XRE-family HTH domain [Rhizobium sp. SG741]